MTSIAPAHSLRELDENARQAWAQYSETLRELSGDEYERVESESWEQLQSELRLVDERREQLAASTTGPDVG
jgi:hypothetical protein